MVLKDSESVTPMVERLTAQSHNMQQDQPAQLVQFMTTAVRPIAAPFPHYVLRIKIDAIHVVQSHARFNSCQRT